MFGSRVVKLSTCVGTVSFVVTLFTWDPTWPTGCLGGVQCNLRYMYFSFLSLILQAVGPIHFPLIFLQDCSCVGDDVVKWSWSWALGCYRAPCAANTSSDPWILNINVLIFSVTFTGALAFGSLLCTLVFFPFTSIVTEPSWLKLCSLFQYVFQPFLRAIFTLKKVTLCLSLLIPTFTSPPLHTQLIGESRTENSWSPNIAGIQQAQEKHLTRLSPLSMIKMAGPLTKTL